MAANSPTIDKVEFDKEITSIRKDVKNLDDGLILVKKRLEDLEVRHSQNCLSSTSTTTTTVVGGTQRSSTSSLQDKKIDKKEKTPPAASTTGVILQQQISPQNLKFEPTGIIEGGAGAGSGIDHSQQQQQQLLLQQQQQPPQGKVISETNSIKKADTGQNAATVGRPPSIPKDNQYETTTKTEKHVQNGTITTTTTYTKCAYVSDSSSNVVPYGQDLQNGPVDQTGTVRLIGFKKPKADTHLGLTVHQENGQLVIEKLDDGSQLSKQGVLHVGDWIVEVNGVEVKTPDDLKNHLKDTEAVSLKVVPSGLESAPIMNGDFVRCCFDYDPTQDDQIPSKSIGLSFKVGDVLQLISKEDAEWWQARKVNDWSYTGLIPSQYLAERRKAAGKGGAASGIPTLMVGGEIIDDAKKKVKKLIHNATKPSSDGDVESEVQCYEEVCKLSPYGRRVLVLIGASGVGRRTLKARLMHHDKENFATITPYTSRKQKEGEFEGREYHFASKPALEKDIDQGNFLEWGEYNGNIYGTKLDSVRKVIKSGRVCVLDCSPQAIKYLYNSEYMPFIVFIAPPPLEEFKQIYQIHPNRTKVKAPEDLAKICEESTALEQQYRHLFDLILMNRNAEVTFRRLYDALESLKSQPQWVPASWIYG